MKLSNVVLIILLLSSANILAKEVSSVFTSNTPSITIHAKPDECRRKLVEIKKAFEARIPKVAILHIDNCEGKLGGVAGALSGDVKGKIVFY